MSDIFDSLLARCVSIDLEVNPRTARIFAFAAVRHGDAPPILSRKGAALDEALDRLEGSLGDVDHLIGHNILRHDLPYLAAVRLRLANMVRSPIDTLWLNPLAFPRNPYHHLVKHHHDGRLQAGHVNDPERDARLVFELFESQIAAFRRLNDEAADAMTAYHYLTTRLEVSAGFDALFRTIRKAPVPSIAMAEGAIRRLLSGRACEQRVGDVLDRLSSPRMGWPLAYALAWISVAGGDSVMPPWVRAKFSEASNIVRHLRDTTCRRPDCGWCREADDPARALSRWFGFDAFRPQPADDSGRSLQERIVDEVMRNRSVLGILPTGTGKSVCYQVPALSKFDKIGALTVVISPLVALMADQVQGMARAGISSAVTINSLLSMPERQQALDQIRMGEAAMLLISPEQLRSVSIRSVLAQREVGLWVLDEAHCVSKWGHDFRPDYRYVGRFIKEFSGDQPPAPLLCLTATAKPEVVRDICEHFQSRLGTDLLLLDGGAVRTNLTFEVRSTQRATKLNDILDVITSKLPKEGASGAVIYCATRSQTEKVAAFLKQQGLSAERFHAGLSPDEKSDIQERFRVGELRIIAATNAFGMGIDKPDIRLVVHGDIPGSLENYLQEAGRAGRDRAQADCVLLFASEDVERQFSLSARSRLARHEIGAILKALRRMDERTQRTGEIVVTAGEIVRAERDREFERDSTTDDTRVKTAVSWLEEAALLAREENRVRIFPSSLRVRTMEEAETRLAQSKVEITAARRRQLLGIVRHLMNAAPDQGISTDELAGVGGLTGGGLNKAMADLETLGIARNDVAVTLFLHVGVEGHSQQRLRQAANLETDLIALMREAAPDAEQQEGLPLHLSEVCQALRDRGHAAARPDILEKLLRSMARDGRDQDGGRGNIRLRKSSRNALLMTLQRSWQILEQTATMRRQAAELLLNLLIGKVAKGKRGKDIQVETTIGDMRAALESDAFLYREVSDMAKLLERALMWLHEQEVVTLGKGLTVFRPAMTIHLRRGGGSFTSKDFAPLEEHYGEQTMQTHVMAAYAEKGLAAMDQALRLSEDYFVLDRDDFLRRWLSGQGVAIRRQTTGASWKAIVDALDNPAQQRIVSDDREQTNVLVLAGPGAGKTRTLVHRIAYLVRVRRENPHGILVLSYNRHAAAEIRARLRQLIGDDAHGVTVSTCHALAMRLVGASFAGTAAKSSDFDGILREAVRQLSGEGLTKVEAEAQRDALIQGYRWILVDEYQDIGPEEYALIAAVAGRSLEDPDLRLSLFAVGDDDQNIYAFDGASIRFIRQFETDYKARPEYLTENYRSTRHIIAAANAVIAPAADRMKAGHDIVIDGKRGKAPAGGAMAALDPVGQGRVQLLHCPSGGAREQAVAAVDELVRLSRLDPDWNWARTAIISRDWQRLEPARSYAETRGIPVEMANENPLNIWRLREMRTVVAEVRRRPAALLGADDLREILVRQPSNRWTGLIAEGIALLEREIGDGKMAVPDLIEWLAEWSRDARGEQRGLLLLTAHRAKGLEFDDVVILDGPWERLSKGEDADAPRRLFYVAMTRARRSLAAVTGSDGAHPYLSAARDSVLRRRVAVEVGPWQDVHYRMPDMGQVDLSYAGRLRAEHAALAAIADARVGDPLTLVARDGKWLLHDAQGRPLGRMSGAFTPPDGLDFLRGEVGAIVRWSRADNEEKYRDTMVRDEWETVLPELVFGRRSTGKEASE